MILKMVPQINLRAFNQFLLLFLVIFINFPTFALLQAPSDLTAVTNTNKYNFYGPDFNQKILAYQNNEGLKNYLQTLISIPQVRLTYDQAKGYIFGNLDIEFRNGSYCVKDVYCQRTYSAGISPKTIPHYDMLNVEHTWPQSKFSKRFPRELQKSDLHHLYPSDSFMNNKRANHKFGIVNNSKVDLKCDESKLGKTSDGFRFEPPNQHKGEVARAIFYFSVRYNLPVDNDEETVLRQWHHEDPPDQQELSRHEAVFNIQKNRNPFIDFPELVNSVSNF